jgi:hypothetical protein
MPNHAAEPTVAQYTEADVSRAQNVATGFAIAVTFVLGVVVIYSASQGHDTLVAAGVGDRMAWWLTPAVDVALAACLYAAAPLRKMGVTVKGGIAAEIFLAFLTLVLNCGGALKAHHYYDACMHTIPVFLLVTVSMVAAVYLRQYAGIVAAHGAQERARRAQVDADNRARQAEVKAARDAADEARRTEAVERERLAASIREAELLAAAEQAETERLRIEADAARTKLDADRLALAAQVEANRTRLLERAAASPAPRSDNGSGPKSGTGSDRKAVRPAPRSESESGSQSESDEDLLDRTRILFESHRAAGNTRQPSVDLVRQTLRIAKGRAADIHHQVAAEEAARAVARDGASVES